MKMIKMFRFKKKEKEFKLIGFSEETARMNPDMIIREYEHLIGDLERQIETIKYGFGEHAHLLEAKIRDVAIGMDIRMQSDCNLSWSIVAKIYRDHELDIFRCEAINGDIKTVNEEMNKFRDKYYGNRR